MAMQLCREIQRSFIQQKLMSTFSMPALYCEYREDQRAVPRLWRKGTHRAAGKGLWMKLRHVCVFWVQGVGEKAKG